MKLKLLLSYLVFAVVNVSMGQVGDTLIGSVNGQLIKISHTDAGTVNYQVINPSAPTNLLKKLSWSNQLDLFYSLHTPGVVTNQISTIDAYGNYSIKGSVTVPGQTVYFLEALTYDNHSGYLYAAASLNGNNPSDYWSETLLRIDTATLVGTVIGEFSHSGTIYEAEADNLVLDSDGFIYYSETQGGGSAFMRIYKQPSNLSTPPVQIYGVNTESHVDDLTIKGGYLYYSTNRSLRKIELSSLTHSNIGTMFTPSDFGGEQLMGLDGNISAFVGFRPTENFIFSVYPNPTNGFIKIDFNTDQIKRIEFISPLGKMIQSETQSGFEFGVDLSKYPSGIYLVRIYTESGIYTKQIIKQ